MQADGACVMQKPQAILHETCQKSQISSSPKNDQEGIHVRLRHQGNKLIVSRLPWGANKKETRLCLRPQMKLKLKDILDWRVWATPDLAKAEISELIDVRVSIHAMQFELSFCRRPERPELEGPRALTPPMSGKLASALICRRRAKYAACCRIARAAHDLRLETAIWQPSRIEVGAEHGRSKGVFQVVSSDHK